MSEATLGEEVEAIAAATVSTVHHAVQEHPYATVAAGLGAGYVLASGVPDWVVRAGAAIGVRMVMREVVSAAVDTLRPDDVDTEHARPAG